MTLSQFYKLHGESEALLDIEAALDDKWTSTRELALRADRSVGFGRKALGYLRTEGRAEGRLVREPGWARKGWQWRRAEA